MGIWLSFLFLFVKSSEAFFSLEKAFEFWNYCSATMCPDDKLSKWDVGPISKAYPNLSDIRIIHNKTGDSMAYLAYNKVNDLIYVVFRGTQTYSIINWLSDFDAIKINYVLCENCKVHQGFYNTYMDLKQALFENLDNMLVFYKTAQIRILGHSLGGACAVLASYDIRKTYDRINLIYTFGCPRVGNEEYALWWNENMGDIEQARVTHNHDPVPHLPPQFMGFKHVSQEYFFPSQNLSQLIVCKFGEEDPKCSDQYFIDLNGNDHTTYMNQDCNSLKTQCGG